MLIFAGELAIVGDLVMNKKCIGEGAFGTVFKGRLGNQTCAVKVLRPLALQLLMEFEDITVQDEALKRLLDESKILEDLKHPNVVKHLCSYKDPKSNLPILVMELMDESLTRFLKSEKPLSPRTEASLSLDIASALQFIHSENIIHRDLCSDNVLLLHRDGATIAKLSDFGMSKILHPDCMSLTSLGHRLPFLPPEAGVIARKDYDFSLDIFSFGVVVIQIVMRASRIISVVARDDLVKKIKETHSLHSLIRDCIQNDKKERPNAEQICRNLRSELGSLKKKDEKCLPVKLASSNDSMLCLLAIGLPLISIILYVILLRILQETVTS